MPEVTFSVFNHIILSEVSRVKLIFYILVVTLAKNSSGANQPFEIWMNSIPNSFTHSEFFYTF